MQTDKLSQITDVLREQTEFLAQLRHFYYESEYSSGYACPSCDEDGEHREDCELVRHVNKAREVLK